MTGLETSSSSHPIQGVIYHWIGGLGAASFYLPYRAVKKWSWETYWIVGAFFGWIVAPMMLAFVLVPDAWKLICQTPFKTLAWTYFFGLLWGVGGSTYGLTMRYLGIALGGAVVLGICAAVGTLVPPIVGGEMKQIVSTLPGRVTVLGVLICLVGIVMSGMAGMSKERELPAALKKETVAEFNFPRGLFVAIVSGVLSACFAFGLTAGEPLGNAARESLLSHGKPDLWQNLPVLVVVLWGGFTTNIFWCEYLNYRHKSGGEYLGLRNGRVANDNDASIPTIANYTFSAIAGVTWYAQFFFYSMGQTKLGRFHFSSWTLHMASIIIFATLWGIVLHEWRGTSTRTHRLIAAGLIILVFSTIVVGYGNYLKSVGAP